MARRQRAAHNAQEKRRRRQGVGGSDFVKPRDAQEAPDGRMVRCEAQALLQRRSIHTPYALTRGLDRLLVASTYTIHELFIATKNCSK